MAILGLKSQAYIQFLWCLLSSHRLSLGGKTGSGGEDQSEGSATRYHNSKIIHNSTSKDTTCRVDISISTSVHDKQEQGRPFRPLTYTPAQPNTKDTKQPVLPSHQKPSRVPRALFFSSCKVWLAFPESHFVSTSKYPSTPSPKKALFLSFHTH
jgi:hypothetical protein